MPNTHEVIDNAAIQPLEFPSWQVWLSNSDLKKERSQPKICKNTSNQRKFSIVGGKTTVTYQLFTGFTV